MLLLAELVENKPRIKLSSAVTAFYVSRSFNNLSNLVAEIFIFVMDLFLYLEFEMEQEQSLLSLPVLADGVVHGAHVVPGLALQVHPVVPVLSREGEAVLVVHVVWFSLVPGGVVPDKERVSLSVVRDGYQASPLAHCQVPSAGNMRVSSKQIETRILQKKSTPPSQ